MPRLIKVGCGIELMLGWKSACQPNTGYTLRHWGVACCAVFVGIVTAFEEK